MHLASSSLALGNYRSLSTRRKPLLVDRSAGRTHHSLHRFRLARRLVRCGLDVHELSEHVVPAYGTCRRQVNAKTGN